MSVDPVASSRYQDAPTTTGSSQQRKDGLGEFSPTWYGFLWPVWTPAGPWFHGHRGNVMHVMHMLHVSPGQSLPGCFPNYSKLAQNMV